MMASNRLLAYIGFAAPDGFLAGHCVPVQGDVEQLVECRSKVPLFVQLACQAAGIRPDTIVRAQLREVDDASGLQICGIVFVPPTERCLTTTLVLKY